MELILYASACASLSVCLSASPPVIWEFVLMSIVCLSLISSHSETHWIFCPHSSAPEKMVDMRIEKNPPYVTVSWTNPTPSTSPCHTDTRASYAYPPSLHVSHVSSSTVSLTDPFCQASSGNMSVKAGNDEADSWSEPITSSFEYFQSKY